MYKTEQKPRVKKISDVLVPAKFSQMRTTHTNNATKTVDMFAQVWDNSFIATNTEFQT
jgi:hypothetical protein